MLILTRRLGETLNIGDDIEITIVDLHASRVQIGVSAPRHVQIKRDDAVKPAPKRAIENIHT